MYKRQLVNNAGISHADTPGRSLEEVVEAGRLSVASLVEVHAVFETNVFGVIAVTQAMLPLLRESPAARIVNIASSGGSLTLNSDRTNPHRSMFEMCIRDSKSSRKAPELAFSAWEPNESELPRSQYLLVKTNFLSVDMGS